MKILVAKDAGYCFGVRDAVQLAEKSGQEHKSVFMLGDTLYVGENDFSDTLYVGENDFSDTLHVGEDDLVILCTSERTILVILCTSERTI